ncbi:hypothetical protein [Clostridium massiliodielmoense]|uniref:hypothetical protein n=1 Tax=Clostridium massiliodielmoense TaxID=1776385 RepID=UPI0004D7DAD1|nr:hypothetical protein [Clostridium massiliodielmoense]KEH98251.1 esterase [Clostridium botulinum C/D str. BKT12695]
MENLKVTSIEELKRMALPDIIELPPFKEEIPFVAKVKRVSLLNLVQKGVIPNALLSAAEELFYGKESSKGVDMQQMSKVMAIMAESTLVEPSIKDLKQVNLELTDEQLITLFNYSQQGLKGLSTFHSEGEDTEHNSHK